ncbi:MAG: hydroxymethylglutaryl-CoA lyase [Pseudomonadota bacterium]
MHILEVSPRDGLQNEPEIQPTAVKIALINRAIDAGIKRVEVASFVHPKRVPQMADAEAVIEGLEARAGVTYIGLVLNVRGAERALQTKVGELGAVVVASDTFAQKNQGEPTADTIKTASSIVKLAKANDRRSNVTISAAFGCPFEGEVSPDRIVDIAKRLADVGPDEIAIADTIGVADPWRVEALFNRVREAVPGIPLRGHFHNTRNTGIANAFAAYRAGAETLDASIGGIGGCPFAPAATGNIPTEDLLYMFSRGGVDTSVDLGAVIDTATWLSSEMGRPLPAMVSKAGAFPATAEAA